MRERGVTLVVALFVSILLLLVGLGFLGQREGQMRAAQEHISYIQAKALADAGLEDALGKLAKDIEFPPIPANDQSVFSYAEDYLDPAGVLVGSFRVSIDSLHSPRPYGVLQVKSVGILGPTDNPVARVERSLEIDMAKTARVSNGPLNPDVFKVHFRRTNTN